MNHLGTAQESSLLLTLAEISQLVAHSHDPRETLENIVRLIQGRFHTDVCSVYLLEPEQGELVLGATIGLRPESVGRVRMQFDEGLTGLVAQGLTPVMVEDAFSHPRFKYFPEAGEDPYHSFLGVPLVEAGTLQGVLVVQTVERRPFSSNESRMLVTVASQLAPLISGARLLDRMAATAHDGAGGLPVPTDPENPASLSGVSLSPGRGWGEAYVVNAWNELDAVEESRTVDLARESQRLVRAREAAREEIARLSQRISALVGQDHGAILQAQLLILQDRLIEQDLLDCLQAGSTAEAAVRHTLEKYVASFQGMTAAFFQERLYDVKDVFRRILWHLRPRPAAAGTAGGRFVLVAPEASVMDLFSVDLDCLAAVAVERGGLQSHAAILARSLGVPMVGQLSDHLCRLSRGRQLLVDGSTGLVTFDPLPEVVVRLSRAPDNGAYNNPETPLSEEVPPDRPRVEANINLLCEVPKALARHAAGVGLFRSEFLFLARRTLPTEEEQVRLYRKVLTLLRGRPANIRHLRPAPRPRAHGTALNSAMAGSLDWRRVLDSPPMQQLFKEQVRAILRAATTGPARILVPLVVRTEQLDWILQVLDEARAELRRDGLEFRSEVPLGIMIEVAGAAAMVETWAAQVDFFTLGTNDLVASALGMDRDDPGAAGQNDPLHPGVLRLIHDVIRAAHRAGRSVTVCGEMASDAAGAVVLTALQVNALSVAVNQLGATRAGLRTSAPETPADLISDLLSAHGR